MRLRQSWGPGAKAGLPSKTTFTSTHWVQLHSSTQLGATLPPDATCWSGAGERPLYPCITPIQRPTCIPALIRITVFPQPCAFLHLAPCRAVLRTCALMGQPYPNRLSQFRTYLLRFS